MKIIGADFTSSPSRKKPITFAYGELDEKVLKIFSVEEVTDFIKFEAVLGDAGPYVAGLDFPFGQSQTLINNLGWPNVWQDYVGIVSKMDRNQFCQLLDDYKKHRATGDKEHRRKIDELASSISPQKLYGVPVGKMFYEGAKRLLATDADIVPVRRLDSTKVIVEAYPAIIARRIVGKNSYKNDQKKKQTKELYLARKNIVDGIFSDSMVDTYKVSVAMSDEMKDKLVDDATGDTLDAVLCAIQAGWAYQYRDRGYGIPENANPAEGWIADPLFLSAEL
ncbi:MAG: DUF429 domain-containing protein [Gammaproteobacteria bacterium]|nr:DUF429 domain-containing protein [Gammaproteobacteria bacterium]MDH5653837.1 DUF429 domain-containing protein [Gammaproteobacteria bacterium]